MESNNNIQEKKWPKPAALYIENKGTDYKCIDCQFWRDKKCALYGEDVNISEDGTCGMWIEKNGKEENDDWIGTTTKSETGYEENKNGFSCKRCEYFNPENKSCKKVEGEISPDGCCNRWEKLEKKPLIKLRVKINK